MEFRIDHPSQPSRLILSWEPPIAEEDRTRWAVGELSVTEGAATFRYYDPEEFLQKNSGRTVEQLRATGYLGYPAFNTKSAGRLDFHEGVLDAFLRRIPPSNREDFGRYLAYFGFDSSARPGSLAVLGTTGARLPSDGFSLIDPLDAVPGTCEIVLEIVGTRHYPDVHPQAGDTLTFIRDPDNRHDPNAVRATISDQTAGYVNRLQAANFGRLLETRNIEACVHRRNGTTERPRLYAFVKIHPRFQSAAA